MGRMGEGSWIKLSAKFVTEYLKHPSSLLCKIFIYLNIVLRKTVFYAVHILQPRSAQPKANSDAHREWQIVLEYVKCEIHDKYNMRVIYILC